MFKEFILKHAVKKQLAGVPEDQQKIIINAIEKNPQLFVELAEEVKKKVEGGMAQADAVALVLSSRQDELRSLLQS